MKVRNNKGFAITTVIYGLSIMGLLLVAIMMATMSTNRTNSRELSKSIEDELNLIKGSERAFEYDNGGDDVANIPRSQEYIVPEGKSGFYKIELWGSQGAGDSGGLGAYTSGVILLNEGDRLYFYVGRHVIANGGRATEVRVISGEYNDPNSYRTRIMVAAGGGTQPTAAGGTLYGYNNNMLSLGGAMLIDKNNINSSFNIVSGGATNGSLMGFKVNYARSALTQYSVAAANFGPTGNPAQINNAGGDGYYGSTDMNTGGTSYISGYGGCETIGIQGNRSSNAKYSPTFFLQKTTYDEENDVTSYTNIEDTNLTRRYVFLDGRMYPGVNYGDGKAKISLVAATTNKNKIRKNSSFDNVKKITDCVAKSTGNIQSVRFAVISDGIDYGSLQPTTSNGDLYCAAVTIANQGKNVDEIAVWHYTNNVADPASRVGIDGKDVKNHSISITTTDGNNKPLSALLGTSETETVTGLRYSAYQPDPQMPIPNGVYYIVPVLSENKVLTAAEKAEEDANAIEIEPFMGYKRQKWSIELITDKNISPDYRENVPSTYEYRIIEQARYKALTISKDENMIFNEISAGRYFNNYQRDTAQIWRINASKDGTYYITTVAPYLLHDGLSTGNIAVNSNSQATENQNKVLIGKNVLNTERYKLISANYFDKGGE